MIPVYEMLIQSVPDEDLTVEQKELFVKNTKEIDSNGQELVYVIIKSYEKGHSDTQSLFPYSGKMQKSGIKFEIESLPIKLRQVLFKFVEMHIKSQKERLE